MSKGITMKAFSDKNATGQPTGDARIKKPLLRRGASGPAVIELQKLLLGFAAVLHTVFLLLRHTNGSRYTNKAEWLYLNHLQSAISFPISGGAQLCFFYGAESSFTHYSHCCFSPRRTWR
ncbi:hypothetical protein, partial [Microseira sp. BLCC-F43]|uniref:hypothetical protein n=1 Tax=Microseira sp. BLCC-F43 TaxID=3153602 RepID=UPI0035B80838